MSRQLQDMPEKEDTPEDEEIDTSHLDNVEDGCGCTEIWEHMSDERDESDE